MLSWPAGLAICTILLLTVPGCLSRQVSASEQMSMSAAAKDSQTHDHASCSAALPKLLHHQTWQSSHNSCAADITVVTHLESSQLVLLGHLCATWKGWVAAAVYVAPGVNMNSYLSALGHWHTDLDGLDACALNLAVYSWDVSSGDEQLSSPPAVPVNALRNRATSLAITEMVLPLDVNHLVSNSLRMHSHSQQLLELASAGTAIVIPAWESTVFGIDGQQIVTDIVQGSKEGVVKAFSEGIIDAVGAKSAVVRQHVSDLRHWLQTDALYGVQHVKGYEPDVVLSKKVMPWFDERIYNSSLGRRLFGEHLHALGQGFVVHPSAFILRQPLSETAPPAADNHKAQKTNELLFDQSLLQMAQKMYRPASHYAPCSQPYQSPADISPLVHEQCHQEIARESKPAVSPMWGVHGELFSPQGKLRDWSRAGYGAGDRPIPRPASFSDLVVDWDAAGDGITDDTEALTRAIQQSPEGSALQLPPGRFKITKMINITKPIILRGSGAPKTTLYFPFSLTDIYDNTPDSTSGYSQWAFRPGFLNFLGSDPIGPETLIGHVVQAASRGDNKLVMGEWVNSTPPIGSWIRLVQSDPSFSGTPPVGNSAFNETTSKGTAPFRQVHAEGSNTRPPSLINHLHGEWEVAGPEAAAHVSASELQGTQYAAQLLARVVSATNTALTIDRALPFDVSTEWHPEFHAVNASLKEAGVEELTIEFAEQMYGGHFKEAGYNALYFSAAHDCWVRNVSIVNADYAVGLNGTHFCTLEGIRIYDSKPRGGGHHGIDISFGADNLVTNFTISQEFLHDVSIEWYTHGNVISDGSGSDLNMDHHRGAAFGNLFTNLQLGKGSRPFASSGAHGRGPHAGAHNTYWNLISENCWAVPHADFGHSLFFAGAQSAVPCSVPRDQSLSSLMHPRDLHNAMQVWHHAYANISRRAEIY